MVEYCSLCNIKIEGTRVYCDVIEGVWHMDCFNFQRCEEKHGEGCSTICYVDIN